MNMYAPFPWGHAQATARTEGLARAEGRRASNLPDFARGPVAPSRDRARLIGLVGVLIVHGLALLAYFLAGPSFVTRNIAQPLMVVSIPPEEVKPLEPPPPPKFTPPAYVPQLIVPEVILTVPPPPVTQAITIAPMPPSPAPPDAPRATAPAPPASPPPIPAPSMREFAGKLFAHLERFKRYPASARMRREEGVVSLRFTMDGEGHVLAYAIARSSGFKTLDDEALAMIKRAEPLPAIPVAFQRQSLDLVLGPIEFFLR